MGTHEIPETSASWPDGPLPQDRTYQPNPLERIDRLKQRLSALVEAAKDVCKSISGNVLAVERHILRQRLDSLERAVEEAEKAL